MSYRSQVWEDFLDGLAGRPPFGITPLPDPKRRYGQLSHYHILKEWTGQDFGMDEHAWRAWMKQHDDWMSTPEADARLDKLVARRKAWFPLLDGLSDGSIWLRHENTEETVQERAKRQEKAHEFLTERTGQDFGYDVDAWSDWMLAYPDQSDKLVEGRK